MNQKLIFGIVGEIAAGKGAVNTYFVSKYKASSYRFSSILRDILERLGIEERRENLQNLSQGLREYLGQDILSRAMATYVQRDQNQLIVIEGIRRPSDIEYLKQVPGFHLVYLTANAQVRWERLIVRNENPGDAEKTFKQFLKDEKAEADHLLASVAALAEDQLTNDGTIKELHQQLDLLYKKYQK